MAAQLSQGRGYIGGGSIAGILGLSPFKSPLGEYLLITGQRQDEVTPEKARFFARRKALEPFAAECFTQTTGMAIIRRNERYHHPAHAFMQAEIDFETEEYGNGETKTVRAEAASQWGHPESGDEPPLYVTAQAMWGLGLTGRDHCWVHALVGLDDDRIFRVERDETLISTIQDKAMAFWTHHVLARRPPQPTTVEDLAALYIRDSGRAVEADDVIRTRVGELLETSAALKVMENSKETLELAIKLFMRDATTLTINGQQALSWKAQDRNGIDTEAFKGMHPDLYEQFRKTTTSRVFRVK